MHEITQCEVCSNTELLPVLNLGSHPLPDDLKPIGTEELSKEYPVEVLFCDKCNTAHQRFQIPKHKLFPPSYHYRAQQTQDVLNGMADLVSSIAVHRTLRGVKVLDIGCNDGSLLTEFKRRGAETFGIDPTDAAIEARSAGHTVRQAFFDLYEANKFVSMHGHPDIVTFTNVFAHIDNLPGLLTAVKALLGNETTVVIENHYLGAILERNQFDTFYHEHPRTYSFTSFKFIAGKLGMRIADVEFPSRYGGNIRVTLDWGSGLSASGPREHDMLTRFDRLRTYVATWTRYKSTELRDLFFTQGRINCIAFPGRAAILMRLLNIPDVMWGNVYEKPGSKKIGYYVPGTHVPIVSDALYPMDSVKPLVNLAWHIPKEIEHRWRLAGFHGTIIQVVDAEDFRA